MQEIIRVVLALKVSTVQALVTDTLVRGQLLLRPPSEYPVFLNSHTDSVLVYSRKRPVALTEILSASSGCPLTRVSTVVSFSIICCGSNRGQETNWT